MDSKALFRSAKHMLHMQSTHAACAKCRARMPAASMDVASPKIG